MLSTQNQKGFISSDSVISQFQDLIKYKWTDWFQSAFSSKWRVSKNSNSIPPKITERKNQISEIAKTISKLQRIKKGLK